MPSHDRPTVRVVDGRPAVDPDPLQFRTGVRNITIVWQLDDPAFAFTTDGIRIDGEETPQGLRPQSEIVDGRVVAGGKQFIWFNRNSRPGKYKYTIRLQGPGGIVETDPSIINGAGL